PGARRRGPPPAPDVARPVRDDVEPARRALPREPLAERVVLGGPGEPPVAAGHRGATDLRQPPEQASHRHRTVTRPAPPATPAPRASARGRRAPRPPRPPAGTRRRRAGPRPSPGRCPPP